MVEQCETQENILDPEPQQSKTVASLWEPTSKCSPLPCVHSSSGLRSAEPHFQNCVGNVTNWHLGKSLRLQLPGQLLGESFAQTIKWAAWESIWKYSWNLVSLPGQRQTKKTELSFTPLQTQLREEMFLYKLLGTKLWFGSAPPRPTC